MKYFKLIFSGMFLASIVAQASSGCFNCVNPYYGSTMGNFPFAANPWWNYYGAFSYPNFYYPGPWAGWGMNPNYYPGSGHVGLAKPNVYIKGKPGTKVKIEITKPSDSTWLATVPPLDANATWSFSLGKDGKLSTGKAQYSYAFYDLRVSDQALQDQAGLCFVEKQQMLDWMSDTLKKMSFSQSAIKDFQDHWSYKIPQSEKYCVFPQMSNQLNPVAELKVIPVPQKISRIVFVVTVKEALALSDSSRKFRQEPTQKWTLPDRSIAADSDPTALEVHEWGVGFLFAK